MIEESASAPASGDRPPLDARAAVGVQVGEGNTQIIYQYAALTWGDGVAPPPLASVSGRVESPYRGLASYEERDAAFFFGRNDVADAILRRLSEAARVDDSASNAIVVVSGSSGAGKSSLIRAGVLPRLRGAAALPVRRRRRGGHVCSLPQGRARSMSSRCNWVSWPASTPQACERRSASNPRRSP